MSFDTIQCVQRLALSATVASVLAAAACTEILGIGDPALVPLAAAIGGGGAGGEGGQGGMPPGPCHPTDPSCNTIDSDCIALVDNRDLDVFGLRIQQVSFWKPDTFSEGPEYTVLSQSLTLNLEACYLQGGGTINLIVEVDVPTATARVGAARYAENPADGYSFVDDVVEVDDGVFFNVAPAIADLELDAEGTISSQPVATLTLPLYLDQAGASLILVPLRQGRLFEATLSSDQNCVGSFNEHGLDPNAGCLPNLGAGLKSFVDGGKLEGYVLLEEADSIIVTAFGLNRSLCALFAQDDVFIDGGSPARCDRVDGEIQFPGDWCAASNSGADPSCHDAIYLGASFAASAVKIVP